MKKILLFFALIVGLLTSASTMQAQVNMSSYITITVAKDSAIKLNFKAAAAGTPIRIVSGSNTQNITVGTDWYGIASYTADDTEMTVYGDIIDFGCTRNGANLTALDVSHNTQLTGLWCWDNNLSNLDVSQNTQLGWLFCSENRLSSLDVSGCTQLTGLDCSNNKLSNLDVSHNTQLTELRCYSNLLTSLDVSHNTQLAELYCHGNKFTTAALDDIYCALPDRGGKSSGKIQPVYDSSSSYNDTVLATNKANAIAKNWKVQYWQGNTDIPTTGTYVCGTVHLDTYITLTVAKDFAIKLNFRAAAAGTPVRIVSGSNTRNITVGTGWYDGHYPSNFIAIADGTEMKVYGDIIGFDCAGNGANITALDVSNNTQLEMLSCSNNTLSSLDVSKNTQLTTLYCYGNKFTTAALDDIYCTLPDRTGKGNGEIQPVYDSLSSNHATVLATNKQNAIDKNWNVQYYKGDTDIPPTTGIYVCGTMNLDTYITLTVKQYSAIKLDFKAAAAGTPVHIVNGSTRRTITVDTDWKGTASYTAAVGTKMKIYGDLTGFSCGGNRASLTTIDVSHNTLLTELDCHDNQLSNLDVSRNTKLTYLNCSGNNLDSLDLSQNTKLTYLNCHGNAFTTEVIDDIYCALPVRQAADDARIYPLINSSDPKATTVAATNAQNAIAKNWKVRYASNGTDIPLTTGKHKCSATTDIAEATAEPSLTLYPNPVADVLYLSATARTIRIYNIYGIEVAHATDTDRVEVAHLPAGVYTVRADGMVAKMVKR